eukprot:SAG31_NODE_15737_length_740_cov_2.482059_1_plen_87_part_00
MYLGTKFKFSTCLHRYSSTRPCGLQLYPVYRRPAAEKMDLRSQLPQISVTDTIKYILVSTLVDREYRQDGGRKSVVTDPEVETIHW